MTITDDPNIQSTSDRPTMGHSLVQYLNRAVLLGSGAAGLFGYLTMISVSLSTIHPLLDLASHTSWHMFWGLTVVLMIVGIGWFFVHPVEASRWRIRLLFILVPWFYFGWVSQPWDNMPLVTNDQTAQGLKIYSWNIWIGNRELNQVVEHVLEQNADVVILVELGPRQMEVLKSLEAHFAEKIWIPDGASGIAVFSKISGTTFEVVDLANETMPAIDVTIPGTDKSQACSLLAVHTRSPDFHPYRTRERDRQLIAVSDWAKEQTDASIVIGDLNITPWSKPFQRMLREGRLVDTRKHRGYMGTWPAQLRFAGVPIDHALVTEEVKVLHRSVDPFVSPSDHRGICLIVQ